MDQEALRTWVELLEDLAWDECADGLAARFAGLTSEGLRAVLARAHSDETLALLIQRDTLRTEAYEELLVQRYHRPLLRWFWHWCKDQDRAADLTQDILYRFFENRLAGFDPSRNFRAYLYQAAWYAFLDGVRRDRRRRAQPLESAAEPQAPDRPAPDSDFEERVERALWQLPALQQRVLRETMVGRSADDIALGLNIPRSRVYALLYQARRQMERELQLPSMTRPYRRARPD
jgi:RNA polymerase sigma factor (sigma-70 family)